MDASCSTGNASALKNLVQHSTSSSAAALQFRGDSSSAASSSSAAPLRFGRNQVQSAGPDAFFNAQTQAQAQRMVQNPFDFNQMRNELSLQPIPIEAGIQQQFHQSHEFDQFGLFDEAFGRAKGKEAMVQMNPVQYTPPSMQQQHQQPVTAFQNQSRFVPRNRNQLFTPQPFLASPSINTPIHQQHPSSVLQQQYDDKAFDEAFEEATAHANTPSPIQDQQDWAAEYATSTQQQPEVNIVGSDASSLLAQTAGHLVQTVDGATNPKFANSKFIEFMKQIRDGQLGVEGNKVVELKDGVSTSSATRNQAPLSVSDDWVNEVAGGMRGSSGYYLGDDDYVSQYQLSGEQKQPLSWTSDFLSTSTANAAEAEQLGIPAQEDDYATMEDAFNEFYQQTGTGSAAARMGRLNPAVMESKEKEWEELEMSWNSIGQPSSSMAMDTQPTTTSRSFMEELELQNNYDFVPSNPYVSQPLERLKDVASHQNLSDSILSLEAAVQIDPMDATSWKNLGLRQQENENEGAAINALRKAIELDPTLLDSHIALAVSYTNESMFSEAYKALEGWLTNNPQYSHLLSQQPATNFNHHEHLTTTFLAAARLSSTTSFDAGPQMALGVLFNISGDHAKAMDCFQSCLASHPQDYQLWNKLGATLANSKDPSRALEAYTRALQLNPDFLRARYNVAIAYLQLGKYADAVRHLVAILECQEMNMQSVVAAGDGVGAGKGYEERVWEMHSMASGSTWNTLWMVMDRYLNRPDLAKAADEKNLNVFRNLDFLSTGYEEGPSYA